MNKTIKAISPSYSDPFFSIIFNENSAFKNIHPSQSEILDRLDSSEISENVNIDAKENKINFKTLSRPYKESELCPSTRLEMTKTYLNAALAFAKKGLKPNCGSIKNIHIDANSKPFYFNYSNISEITDINRFPLLNFLDDQVGVILLNYKYPNLVGLTRDYANVDMSDYLTIKHPIIYKILSSSLFNKSAKTAKLTSKLITLMPLILDNIFSPFNILTIFKYLKNRNENPIKVLKLVQKLLNKVDKFNFNGKWTNYYSFELTKMMADDNFAKENFAKSVRASQIAEVLDRNTNNDKTLLDLGSNQGYFSLLAAHHGYKTIALDYDYGAINEIFNNLKNSNYKHTITPIRSNISLLTDKDLDRLACDNVLALGLTHHLWYVEGLSWDEISRMFDKLTNNTLITEFKFDTRGRGTKAIKGLNDAQYSIESFKESLLKYFSKVEILDEQTAYESKSKRRIVVCTK